MKNDKLNDPFYVKELSERLDFLISVKSAKNSLYEFLKQAWPIIEGNTPFMDNWHLEVVAQHLEACYRREIKRLIINVPPRSGKTTLISIAFPAWIWLQNQEEKFVYASYANSLSLDHSRKCRMLIESNWYQSISNGKIKFVKDQNAKGYFQNINGGYRMATSVESRGATGKGGSFLVCDDPNSAGDSELQFNNVNKWLSQEWTTRLNNPKEDVMIVVQQRLNALDMTGYILKNDTQEEWMCLVLPNEYEIKERSNTILNGKIWQDPRTKEGELLSPLRIGDVETKKYQKELGSYGYAGQFQQRPSPIGGGHIKKEWFKKWIMPNQPKFDFIIQSWDTAFSDKPNAAYSACTTWGVWKSSEDNERQDIMLLSMWRGRVGYPELRIRAQRLTKNYKDTGINKPVYNTIGKVDVCLIEAKATGDPLIRDLRVAGVPAIGYIPKGDKNSRVQIISPYIESGLVWLPTESKNADKLMSFADEFVESVSSFPNAESRDLVDTMTQALSYIRDNAHLRNPKDEYEDEVEQPNRKRLY